jgi:hypothetical protein
MSMKEKKGGSISTGCFMALRLSGVLFIPLFTELPPDALSPVSAIPLRIRTGATFFAVPMPKFLAYGKGGPFRMADAVHFLFFKLKGIQPWAFPRIIFGGILSTSETDRVLSFLYLDRKTAGSRSDHDRRAGRNPDADHNQGYDQPFVLRHFPPGIFSGVGSCGLRFPG